MTAKYDADNDVDVVAAAAILEPYVDSVYRVFIDAGLDKLKGIKISVTHDAHDTDRHFAACRSDGRLILLAPHMVNLPPETALGIIGHEFGHAVDSLYNVRVAFDREGLVILDSSRKGGSVVTREALSEWNGRDYDEVERAADRIAEAVLGIRIGYSSVCLTDGTAVPMLQTLRGGVSPRPRGLR